MKKILFGISILSLGILTVSTLLYFFGRIEFSTNKTWLLMGTIGWFISVPFWMKQKRT